MNNKVHNVDSLNQMLQFISLTHKNEKHSPQRVHIEPNATAHNVDS